ncbi:MAG: hypothetical protein JNM23_04195 [Bradyrhizobiaceae bacterium]|nr:hypothetical protein [Bradyrhizobiaceae bacterium]
MLLRPSARDLILLDADREAAGEGSERSMRVSAGPGATMRVVRLDATSKPCFALSGKSVGVAVSPVPSI